MSKQYEEVKDKLQSWWKNACKITLAEPLWDGWHACMYWNSLDRLESDYKTHAPLASSGWKAARLPSVKSAWMRNSPIEGPAQYGYLQEVRLIAMGRWDATMNTLFLLLNKWARGCDFNRCHLRCNPRVNKSCRGARVDAHLRLRVQTPSIVARVWRLCTCCRERREGAKKWICVDLGS